MKKTGLLLVALLTLTQSAYAMLPLTRLILWQPSMPRVLRKMGELPQSAGA